MPLSSAATSAPIAPDGDRCYAPGYADAEPTGTATKEAITRKA